MATKVEEKTLWWSEQGRIECLEHAPYKGSDTWRWGRWKPIKPAEALEFERELGHAPECETCAAIKRKEPRLGLTMARLHQQAVASECARPRSSGHAHGIPMVMCGSGCALAVRCTPR